VSGTGILDSLQQIRTGPFGSLLDLVDVLLLAVIIYQVFLLVRGTRAVHMFLGIVFLLVFYWGTGVVGLRTVHQVLGSILFYVPFAMIVIFQNTIRRGLAAFGGYLPFRRFYAPQPSRLVDDIVLAARAMAQRRIGAILVLEREQGLRSYIETGIAIDALPSYDLLVNLFVPHTPLHDGAAILAEGRIKAAACFLPLTSHPTLSKEFGSRHRAAIGITEETDAVAVVVSEERGEVSAAFEGRLHRDMDDAALRALLRRHLRLRLEGAEREGPVPAEEPHPRASD